MWATECQCWCRSQPPALTGTGLEAGAGECRNLGVAEILCFCFYTIIFGHCYNFWREQGQHRTAPKPFVRHAFPPSQAARLLQPDGAKSILCNQKKLSRLLEGHFGHIATAALGHWSASLSASAGSWASTTSALALALRHQCEDPVWPGGRTATLGGTRVHCPLVNTARA